MPGMAESACPAGAAATCLVGQGTWASTFSPRDLDGNASTIEAYYDRRGLTWLADARYGIGSSFDTADGGAADGRMTFANARAWAASLSFGAPNAAAGWQLPGGFTNPLACNSAICGPDNAAHNLGQMYYQFLGNLSSINGNLVSTNLLNTGPFLGLDDSSGYWSNMVESNSEGFKAFAFALYNGYTTSLFTYTELHAWAVHGGDVGNAVTAVPEPASVSMLLGGLFGLGFAIRLQRRPTALRPAAARALTESAASRAQADQG